MMQSAFLPDQSFLRVTGADASDFLQGLVTTDIEALGDGIAMPSALLTPQGKILFYFLISRLPDGFLIEISADQADGFAKRLTMYKLRRAVEIGAVEHMGVSVFAGEDAPTGAPRDARFATAGIAVARLPGKHSEGDASAYDALRIEACVVEPCRDFALSDAFPHDILMDVNGGVSFKKGCFVGQEVVSRMKHRGTARRRPIQLSAKVALSEEGTTITCNGKQIGVVGTVDGNRALAIVRIDRAGAAIASGATILANETPVELMLPAWSGLEFPTEPSED